MSNEKEKGLLNIPSNVLGEVEPTLLKDQELSPETRTKMQEFRVCNKTSGMSLGSTESREMRSG